ncbi:alkaline phosphatase family protein [Polyangium aurulentum]|uniref:alkaline phosphatase family protein n=1 Tax=Polyangium aurulentum TaxID=2567896 RepID=UPI0010ADC995|nr:alkaline phosphatase family protein [Polyangium aurulentum]UQA57528.1 alkaline phosphatase family protein [Polyangium aurulentum]
MRRRQTPSWSLALLTAVLSLGCSGAPAQPASAPAATSTNITEPARSATNDKGPRVVVTMVVDQLGAWIAAERWPLFPESGGFARLRREGTWAREVRYPYAITDTGPGHATLYTGALPRNSGIFANDLLDPATRAEVSIVHDPTVKTVTAAGPIESAGASLARLRVETLADSLRAARPDAWIVGVSIKDRGSLFAAGRRPDVALWFDVKQDAFVTSTAVSRELPAWAVNIGGTEAIARLREKPWVPLDEAFLRANARTPDASPGEGDIAGFGAVFPHDFRKTKLPAKAFRGSPHADQTLVALGLAALEAAPAGRSPALLAISFSAHDYVGHTFGPDSWEAWDELLRLDAELGRFFEALDARFGKEGWAALLSADHGSTPMPETAKIPGARPWCAPGAAPDRFGRPCGPGGRLLQADLDKELQAEAAAALGPGDWVLGVADPYVHLTPAARALDAGRRDKLIAALSARLSKHPEIERVIDVRTLPAQCPPPAVETVDALVCRSYAGTGDLYVYPRSGSLFDPEIVEGTGGNHGSPHLSDRSVPLLVRAPGRVAAGRVVEAPLGPAAFTRTAASLLGVPPPKAAEPGLDFTAKTD